MVWSDDVLVTPNNAKTPFDRVEQTEKRKLKTNIIYCQRNVALSEAVGPLVCKHKGVIIFFTGMGGAFIFDGQLLANKYRFTFVCGIALVLMRLYLDISVVVNTALVAHGYVLRIYNLPLMCEIGD